jgi:hypothetical protein
MVTNLNQEPFDPAVWITNQLGLNVEIEEEKNRLNGLVLALCKAEFGILNSVSRIDARGITAINSELKEMGYKEIKVGEELSLIANVVII